MLKSAKIKVQQHAFTPQQSPAGKSSHDKSLSTNSGILHVSFAITFYLKYVPTSFFAPKLNILTICTVEEGLVTSHHDHWSVADIIQSLPLIGYLYTIATAICGWWLSVCINILIPQQV